MDMEIKRVKEFQNSMLEYFDTKHQDITKEIEEKKVLNDQLIDQIVSTAKEFKSRWE